MNCVRGVLVLGAFVFAVLVVVLVLLFVLAVLVLLFVWGTQSR